MRKEFNINNFDLLRIFAATQVVLVHGVWHLGVSAPPWFSLLDQLPGVPIFFGISGFLISASYERSSSLKSYVRNRVLRIYPGLWCCVFATILVAAFCGINFLNGQALPWLACQLVGLIYTPSFLKSFGFGSYNGSLWTIPIELQFYLLLPLLYLWTGKTTIRTSRMFIAWLVFTAIAFTTRLAFDPLTEAANGPLAEKLFCYSFVPHFYLFLTGVLLQRLHVNESRWVAGKGLYWIAAYLAFSYLVPDSAATYITAKLLLGAATVSLAFTAPSLSHRILRGNDISYGVYIYHGLIINALIETGLTGRPQYAVLLVAGTFVAGYLSWIGVERRFLRKKRQTIAADRVAAG